MDKDRRVWYDSRAVLYVCTFGPRVSQSKRLMPSAPYPSSEGERLRALLEYRVLDTATEPEFDEITRLAAHICETPTALVTLIDRNRQWFKSRHHFSAPETERAISFSAYTILDNEVLVVPDAARDPRFADNPLVTGEPGIRFYAGAPLTTPSGRQIGSLDVIDYVPRSLSPERIESLRTLSHQIIGQLELRRRAAVEHGRSALHRLVGFIAHVIENRRTKERLRAIDERYRTIVEMSHDLIWAVDNEGRITYLNPAARRIYGRDPEEMIGKSFLDFVPPEQRERDIAAFTEALRSGGDILDQRSQVYHADGSIVLLRANGRTMRDATGKVVGFSGTSRDVTESERAQERLRESNERFELVQRATNDAVWDWDIAKDTIRWSDNVRTLFGYSPAQLQAGFKAWSQLIHPADLRRVTTSVDALFESGGSDWESEYRLRRSDGTYAHVLDRGYVMHDANRRPVRVIGAIMDITARVEAEARFQQLAENISEVFWLTDVVKRQLLYVSPGYESIWGRSAASLLKSPQAWMDAIHPDDRERVAHAAFHDQAAGTYDLEYRIRRPDGTIRWIHDRAFPVRDDAGTVYRIAGVAADITARRIAEDRARQSEEQMRQAQKLEAVGQLSAGVAHDFNNILAVIQGNASLLSDEDSAVERKELVDEVVQAANRGAALTGQLLMFSRKQIMTMRDVNLSEIAESMTKMLRRTLRADIVLETDLDPHLPVIRADSGMMEQVLLNLVVNARDAIPSVGTVAISTRAVMVDEQRAGETSGATPGPSVSLSVSDTGRGIPPDVLRRIFEPFYTTKEAGKGTGLGLATVYGIVRQHGGWLEVETTVGKGTTFNVLIPTAAARVGHQ
jgi:two-component system, cell cycle sensor histidine kinase and response regulator CckA